MLLHECRQTLKCGELALHPTATLGCGVARIDVGGEAVVDLGETGLEELAALLQTGGLHLEVVAQHRQQALQFRLHRAQVVVRASESTRVVAGCGAVTLEQGKCRCVCIACLGEFGARVVQVGLCAHECIGCALRATLGLIECALGDATRSDAHAGRGETIAVTGDD
ncbi:MAG: hypothetical protein EBZ54_06460, partial [Actinobacteria bacterium]|nr:hypothetical protein [Actinomycetota bacterium]